MADHRRSDYRSSDDRRSDNRRIRIGVLFGGRSSEHAISCISAGSVLGALNPDRYDVVPIGITVDGRWVRVSGDAEHLRIVDGRLPAVDSEGTDLALVSDGALTDLGSGAVEPLDVVFPVLHGPWGEDGTVQGLLELMGVPYVGSGVFASAAGMDKAHMKAMLGAAGIPIGRYTVISNRQWQSDAAACVRRCADLVDVSGRPLFVKPARAGSSVGISRVTLLDELPAAIETAREHDPKVVVEAGIEGAREIECAVLVDHGVPRASLCAEIVVRGDHDFYDFAAKYLDDSVDLIVPATLPDEVQDRVQRMALAAFEALDCEGLARVDFFVRPDADPDAAVVVNEVNTMPGFTPISMYPRMWAESGIDYQHLVDTLVDDALRRGTGLR